MTGKIYVLIFLLYLLLISHRCNAAGGSTPEGEPAAEAAGEPAGEPESPPASEPAGEPVGEPASPPAGEPASPPAGEPASPPAGEPADTPTGERPAEKPKEIPKPKPTPPSPADMNRPSHMNEEEFGKIMGLLEGTLDTATAHDISFRDLQQLNSDFFATIAQNSNTETLDILCGKAMQDGDAKTIIKMKRKGIDCMQTMNKNADIKLTGGRASGMLEIMREDVPTSQWNKSHWETALRMKDGLQADDIRNMGASTLRTMVSEGSLRGDTMKRPDQVRALNKKVKMSYGEPNSWDVTAIGELADSGMMAAMDINMLKKINPENLVATANKLKNARFKDRAQQAALGETLLKGFGGREGAENMTVQQVKDAGQFLMTRPTYLNKLSDTVLEEALVEVSKSVRGRGQAAGMARRVRKLASLQNPSGLNTAKIRDIGNVLPALGKKTLQQLNATAVFGALGTLKTAEFKQDEARILTESMISSGLITPRTMDKTHVENMGNLMRGMKSDSLKEIPPQALRDSLDTVAKLDLRPAQGRTIVEAVMNSGGSLGDYAAELNKLMPYVRGSELENVTFGEMKMECNSTAPAMNHDVSRGQARILMAKATSALGAPSADNANYTMDCAVRWGHIMAAGFGPELIGNLPGDAEIANLVEQVAKYDEIMEEAETRAWAAKIEEALLQDPQTVDEATVQQVGQFFRHFSDAQLSRFPRAILPVVCRRIGEGSIHRLAMDDVQRLFAFCLHHVDNNGTIEDHSDAPTLGDNDISSMGSLRCGMTQTHASRLTEETLHNNLASLSNCTFDQDTGSALMANANNKMSDLLDTSDNLVMAAGQLHHLSSSGMEMINQDALADALVDIATTIRERTAYQAIRDKAFANDREGEDRENEITRTSELLHLGLGALHASTQAKRRKRAVVYAEPLVTGTLTCADILVLGNSASVLVASDINSLSTSDFDDCAETLGSISTWDNSVLSALAFKAKDTWGADVSNWTISEITVAGSTVAGLSVADIALLDLTDPDAVFAVSQHSLFNPEQLQTGFTKWLSSTGKSMRDIAAADFLTLSNFLCGATSDDMAGLTSGAYGDSADHVGKLRCFDASQLEIMNLHARTYYGSDVTSWEPTTIASIGTVIGGVTPAELGTLSRNQVAAMVPTVISNIPPTTFTGITESQLRSLTKSQAKSVSVSQQLLLSDAQMSALVEAGGTDLTANPVPDYLLALIIGPLAVIFLIAVVMVLVICSRRRRRRAANAT